eukprot:scaffold706320_cov55-Attheya_sp.AAC.2
MSSDPAVNDEIPPTVSSGSMGEAPIHLMVAPDESDGDDELSQLHQPFEDECPPSPTSSEEGELSVASGDVESSPTPSKVKLPSVDSFTKASAAPVAAAVATSQVTVIDDLKSGAVKEVDIEEQYSKAGAPATHIVVKVEQEAARAPAPAAGPKKRSMTSRAASTAWTFRYPLMIGIAAYVLFMTISGAFLFDRYGWQLPALRRETNRLDEQVEELNQQIDSLNETYTDLTIEVVNLANQTVRLGVENVQLAASNIELNESIAVFADQNEDLSQSLTDLQVITVQLNETYVAFKTINDRLSAENDVLQDTNDVLDAQIVTLNSEIATTNESVATLTASRKEYQDQVVQLTNETEVLEATVDTLTTSIVDLSAEQIALTANIERLEVLNDDLLVLSSFMAELPNDVAENSQAINTYLVEQIDANTVLLEQDMQNTFFPMLDNWQCTLDDVFRYSDPDFVNAPDAAMGTNNYRDVVNYLDTQLLLKMCLNVGDFETFLNRQVDDLSTPAVVSLNTFIENVSIYTNEAISYYFSIGGIQGLTMDDWAAAFYACKNLPEDKRFRYPTV